MSVGDGGNRESPPFIVLDTISIAYQFRFRPFLACAALSLLFPTRPDSRHLPFLRCYNWWYHTVNTRDIAHRLLYDSLAPTTKETLTAA